MSIPAYQSITSITTSVGMADPLDGDSTVDLDRSSNGFKYDLSGKNRLKTVRSGEASLYDLGHDGGNVNGHGNGNGSSSNNLKEQAQKLKRQKQKMPTRVPSKIILPVQVPSSPSLSPILPVQEEPNDQTPLLNTSVTTDTTMIKDPESADVMMEIDMDMNMNVNHYPSKETISRTGGINNGFFLSGSIIFATLFFGFSIGFSVGFLASEKGFFRRVGLIKTEETEIVSMDNSHNVGAVHSRTNLNDTGNNVMNFIEEFLFRESDTDEQSIIPTPREQEDPLMRFSFQGPPSPKKPLIYLNRLDAYALLMDASPGMSTISQYSSDFFLISSGLDAQMNQAYCGTATAVAVLNSLRFLKVANGNGVDIPVDPIYDPYPYATQEDIFGDCTKAHVISHTGGGPGVDGILTPPFGLSMAQVVELLRCHLSVISGGSGWKITEQYVDSTHMTIGKMRFDLKNALMDNNSRVLVNYDRSAVGQYGGGHWSPVGSYSEKEDAFLVLDVAKYKYPPVWIPSERLFDGMATTDDCGMWNYPDGQDALSQEERNAHTPKNYASTLEKLGCQPELRGYIIVTRS